MPTFPPPDRQPVACEINGQKYVGTYWVTGKIITVTNGKGCKSTQVGQRQIPELAEQLLRQVVTQGSHP